jgi:exonuclease VII small subunit
MSLDTKTLQRIERVKASLKLSDLLPEAKKSRSNSIDCPKCKRKTKFYIWEDTLGKCLSTWCDWNKKPIDVIELYRYQQNLTGKGSFFKAIEELEDMAGIEEKRYSFKASALETSLKTYQDALKMSKKAQDYLKGRGWDLDKVYELGVGFAPHSRILRDYGLDRGTLVEAELLDPDSDIEYFYNRVIFPIRNIHGTLVRLTGRSLDPRSEMKWKHSKGGMKNYLTFEDKLASYDKGYVLLTEGYPDAYTLWEKGLPVVGTCGLRGLVQHTSKLEGFKELIAIYDIDTYPEGHPTPGEYKSWSQVIPQLIDLQCLMPSLDINIWFLPGEGRNANSGEIYSGVKDINELVKSSGLEGEGLLNLINKQKINLIDYSIQKWGRDLGYHARLLKLCQSTGKGSSLLESYIPEHMTRLEYAMSVLSS